MEDKFIQEFLKNGLFDIGDNDERLKWLQQSIKDLTKKFKDDCSLLHKYTLVALDPDISDTEQVMIDTEEIISVHWKALRGKYPEMPRNLIRGVILNALYSVGKSDSYAARIIYLTGSNFFTYARLMNEKGVVEEMLIELGEIAENAAVEEWSLIEEEPNLKLTTLKVGGFKFDKVELDKEKLKEKWEEAFTNSSSGHGPQHGLHQANYQQHFITKTTDAIAFSVNSTLDDLNKSLSAIDIETPINKFFTAFKKALDTNLKNSFSSLTAVERRSKLLWWKETLYSSSLKRSYRGLDKNLLPILMSSDLNNQLPEITPISVDFLLQDTLYLLIGKEDSEVKFSEFLSQISSESNKIIIKPYFNDHTDREGRISITEFIALLINNRIELKDFKKRTGIGDIEVITLTNLSVVILHDLLIQRLIAD